MEDSAPRHRFLLGGGASPRSVGGPRRESSRTGTLSSSGPSSCPIHRSAWNKNSRKFNVALACCALRGISGGATMTIEALVGFGSHPPPARVLLMYVTGRAWGSLIHKTGQRPSLFVL